MTYNQRLQFVNDNGKAAYKTDGVFFSRSEVIRLLGLYDEARKQIPKSVTAKATRTIPVFSEDRTYEITGVEVHYMRFDKARGLHIFHDGKEEIKVSVFSKHFLSEIYNSEK